MKRESYGPEEIIIIRDHVVPPIRTVKTCVRAKRSPNPPPNRMSPQRASVSNRHVLGDATTFIRFQNQKAEQSGVPYIDPPAQGHGGHHHHHQEEEQEEQEQREQLENDIEFVREAQSVSGSNPSVTARQRGAGLKNILNGKLPHLRRKRDFELRLSFHWRGLLSVCGTDISLQ